MFDGWQLGLIDEAGYNGIRDADINLMYIFVKIVSVDIFAVDDRLYAFAKSSVEISVGEFINDFFIVNFFVYADAEMLDPCDICAEFLEFLGAWIFDYSGNPLVAVKIDVIKRFCLKTVIGIKGCLPAVAPCDPEKCIKRKSAGYDGDNYCNNG